MRRLALCGQNRRAMAVDAQRSAAVGGGLSAGAALACSRRLRTLHFESRPGQSERTFCQQNQNLR